MKSIFFKVIVSVLLVFTSLQGVSLRESVEQTINTNPTIIAEHINTDAFKKYVDEEEGDYLPTLDLEFFLEKSGTDNNPNVAPPQEGWSQKDGWNGILKFEHILYDGGLTPSEAAQYRHKFYGNNYRSTQEVENIILDTVNSYLDLVSTQELMALSLNNIKVHEEYLVIAKEKEQISGEILETYQVNSKYHFILDRYLEQENEKDKALSLYKKLVGQKLQSDICRPVVDEKFIPSTLEEAVEFGLRRNYRIKEQIEKIKEQSELIVQAKSAFKPTILFQLQGQWDEDLQLPENNRQDIYRARIFMSWNLFEGMKDYHATQKEELFLKEEQKRLDVITSEVIEKIKSSYRTYENYKKRLKNISLFVEDNYNILSVYKKQLADGTRTFLDILNAESELYRSDINKIEQEFEYFKTYYELLFDMSVLSDSILMSDDQTCKKYIYEPREDTSKELEIEDELSDELLDIFADEENGTSQTNSTDINLDEIATSSNSTLSLEEMQNSLKEELSVSKRLNNIYNEISDENESEQSVEMIKEKKTKNVFQEDLFSQKYTINMGNFANKKQLDDFLNNYSLKNIEHYKWGENGKNIKLLYGSFQSIKEAKEALGNLNENLLKLGVYIDNTKKHLQLKNKYSKYNK